jgi:aryl-alcohol dehydrogenase-like predicted oxidoreductase
MMQTFDTATFGRSRQPVCRVGFAATYRPGLEIVRKAIDEGINYFFCYGFDSQTISTLREAFRSRREQLIVATGAYNLLVGHPNIRRTLEKRLRQLGTDYIDVFQFLGVTKPKHMPPSVVEELARLREEGKVRAIGMSCHHRKFAGEMAASGTLDMLMIRYNAAHRGARTGHFSLSGEASAFRRQLHGHALAAATGAPSRISQRRARARCRDVLSVRAVES